MYRAILRPKTFGYLIKDGAYQSAFGLPHFPTSTKRRRRHSMTVKVVDILEHGKPNGLRLYMMTEEQQTGANDVIESLHCF